MTGPDRMRERLRELGRSADSEAAPDLDARLVEHVKLHGPRVVRRSRQRRAVLRVGALLLPVALGVFGWRIFEGEHGRGASEVASGAAPAKKAKSAAADGIRAAKPGCARHEVTDLSFTAASHDRRVLELAERGRAVLEPGAEATLDARDPCRLALRLVRGRVTVHAKDLLGGELRVQAGNADVVVHGTTFAVERLADDVSVDVAEGAVAVEREGRSVAPLVRTGQRLQVALRRAPVLLALSEAESAQLRAAVSEPVALPGASATADETALNVPAATGPGTERPLRTIARSRTSTVAPLRASPRYAASQRSSIRSGDDADSESADLPDTSAGTAQAIGRTAWQRALADSSSARPASPLSAATGRESSGSSSSAAARSDAPAAPDSSAAARVEPPTQAETKARAEPATAEAAPRTEPPARAETAAELVARADALWSRGSRDDARALYRRAGTASGATAQAAWLALARRELAAGRASAARAALDGYTARFPSGALSEEAAGIEFRIALLEHDDALAERSAKRLCERYPNSPAARAAARWLEARGRAP